MAHLGPHWITCRFCGEQRDTSNRYTSPANAAKGRREWTEVHESGACSAPAQTLTTSDPWRTP